MTTTSLQFLASGGYGAVYKYDSKKGLGVVARKVFNINMEQASKHERNVLTRIGRHDNIVAYKGSGVIPAGFCNELIEGAPFIDFDFLDGPSLWELSYKEEIAHDWLTTLPRVCDIIRGLLAAVNHVHTQDFLHLDLKPGNVMVVKAKARDGFRLKPVLIDFGISHHTSDTQQLQDHHGTDGYQPPEWWAGTVPTKAFDVWALGVVFYELLYGQRAVPVNEQLKRMKNRANGMVDSNNNNIYLANRSDEKTDTAERKERLVWQKKYNSAMEKASTEIQPIPRRTGRFQFIVPNDIHALVLHMLGQEKERPTIKEVQASPMFRSFQEGEYEQQRYAKQRALQKVDELQVEKKQVEKQLGRLQEEVNHLRQYNAELEAAPKPPKVKKVDIAVGNEGEDELSAAIRKCANLEQIVRDNDKTIADCVAQIEQEEDKLEMERNEKAKQEQDFAKLKVALENSIQQETISRTTALTKLQQVNEVNERLEKTIQETEARHRIEITKANAEIKALQEQLAAQRKPAAPAAINLPPIRQQSQQRQDQQDMPPDSADMLAQVLDFVGFEQFAVSRVPTEASQRTTNEVSKPSATKRQRTVPDFQHLSLAQYQSVVDAGIDTTKLPNADAAWKALDWAYGLYQNNAGDINKPPDALKQVAVDHSKQSAGTQKTSPFEEWLILVLMKLGVGNDSLSKRNIFIKLTGRSVHAYGALSKRYRK
jgi:serine/threonine protein kinase